MPRIHDGSYSPNKRVTNLIIFAIFVVMLVGMIMLSNAETARGLRNAGTAVRAMLSAPTPACTFECPDAP